MKSNTQPPEVDNETVIKEFLETHIQEVNEDVCVNENKTFQKNVNQEILYEKTESLLKATTDIEPATIIQSVEEDEASPNLHLCESQNANPFSTEKLELIQIPSTFYKIFIGGLSPKTEVETLLNGFKRAFDIKDEENVKKISIKINIGFGLISIPGNLYLEIHDIISTTPVIINEKY